MRLSTPDQTAVKILLSGVGEKQKQAHLDQLLSGVRTANGIECPDCHSETVEDNGAQGVELTFLCTNCGYQWSPNI